MQLKIQRSQRMGGVMGNTVVFCLDAQAEYSRPEADNIARYKLGKQVIYNSRAAQKHMERAKLGTQVGGFWGYAGGAASLVLAKMSLNISIDSLGWGQHIECKDMLELLEAEEEVMVAFHFSRSGSGTRSWRPLRFTRRRLDGKNVRWRA